MITIQSGKMTIPERERFIGFAGDNNVSQKQFHILDISDETFIYRLYLTFDDGTCNYFLLEKSVGESSTTLTWNILEEHIFKSGVVKAQIKAISSDGEIYHTGTDFFIVLPSAEETEYFANKENSEFLHYERFLNTILDNIEITQQSLPYIGDDGYWYVYDANEGRYIKTDFTACCDDERHIIRVDGEMSSTSDNPVKNKTVKSYVDSTRAHLVEKTRKVANLPLSSDITVQQLITALGVSTVYKGTATYPSETNHINGDGYLNVITHDFFVFYSANEAGQKWVKINGGGSSINIDTGLNHTDSDDYVLSEKATNDNYVNKTQYATAVLAGVVKVLPSNGIAMGTGTEADRIKVSRASDSDISAKTSSYKPIVPSNLDFAVKEGIINNSISLTSEENIAALSWLGAMRLIKTVNTTEQFINTPVGQIVKGGNLIYYIRTEDATQKPKIILDTYVKSAYSATSGDIYDVTYINSLVNRIEQLEQQVSGTA